MSKWHPANDNDEVFPAPSSRVGGQASSQIPIDDVREATAAYVASRTQAAHNTKRWLPTCAADAFHPPPPPPPSRHNYALLQPWPPRHHHHIAPATSSAHRFAPPAPSLGSSWTVRPNVMVPGDAPESSPDRGAPDVKASAPGCLRVARSAGGRAASEGRNFLLSPLSLHAALALVAAGANGQTRRELLAFVGSGSLAALRRAAATELVGALRGLPQTSFASGVWVDRRRALRPEFAEVAGKVYAAVAESVDFVSQAEEARQRVNAFVADATNGLIRGVLPPGSVDSSTVIVLANALYFKGTWALPFDRSRTFLAPFHLADGATVRAPFMASSSEQHVAVFPGFKALTLPYKTNEDPHQPAFYMLLLLPDDGDSPKLTDLFDKAVSTPDFLKNHTPTTPVPVGRLMVPKFRFTFEFDASPDMQKLGVTRAFRSGGEFSGMVAGGDELSINGVYYKAAVEVDELGTVAAAATAVVTVSSCYVTDRFPVDFVADRPFLFAIVEKRCGTVMFFGHVVNPLAE